MTNVVDFDSVFNLAFKRDQSVPGFYVFEATADGELLAVVTVDPETAAVYPAYRLPEWATRQLVQEALNMLRRANGMPEGNPGELRQIKRSKRRPSH
jgi:hypothetical protein